MLRIEQNSGIFVLFNIQEAFKKLHLQEIILYLLWHEKSAALKG